MSESRKVWDLRVTVVTPCFGAKYIWRNHQTIAIRGDEYRYTCDLGVGSSCAGIHLFHCKSKYRHHEYAEVYSLEELWRKPLLEERVLDPDCDIFPARKVILKSAEGIVQCRCCRSFGQNERSDRRNYFDQYMIDSDMKSYSHLNRFCETGELKHTADDVRMFVFNSLSKLPPAREIIKWGLCSRCKEKFHASGWNDLPITHENQVVKSLRERAADRRELARKSVMRNGLPKQKNFFAMMNVAGKMEKLLTE